MADEYITKESLIKDYLAVEKKLGKIPASTNLKQYGLPDVSKFNQRFGSWRRFLKEIGKDVEVKVYKRKTDDSRAFTPQEYLSVLNAINNDYPNNDTIMSKNHAVYYNGKFYKAKYFAVSRIKSTASPFYRQYSLLFQIFS